MKKIVAIILLSITYFYSSAQSDEKLIAKDVSFYKVDEIGNVYYVDKLNTLTKYEANVPRYIKYADVKSGKIHSIDVSNPLRVVVFYADQFIVKFLDVNLTEINSFKIKDVYPEGWIRLVCSSNNNGLWMYDELTRKLIKVGEQLITQFQTGDLYLVTRKKINPNFMLEYGDELFLNDPKIGLMVFDLFGGYKKTIQIQSSSNVQFNKDELFYVNKNHWLKYSNFKTDTLQDLKNSINQPTKGNNGYYFIKDSNLYFKSN